MIPETIIVPDITHTRTHKIKGKPRKTIIKPHYGESMYKLAKISKLFPLPPPVKEDPIPKEEMLISKLALLQLTTFAIADVVKSIYQAAIMHPYDMVALGLVNSSMSKWLSETLLSYRVSFDLMVDPSAGEEDKIKYQPVITIRVALPDRNRRTVNEVYDFYVSERDNWENIIRCGYAGKNGAVLRHMHKCGITDKLTYCALNEIATVRISFDVEELVSDKTRMGDNVHMEMEIITDTSGDVGTETDFDHPPHLDLRPTNSVMLFSSHLQQQRTAVGFSLDLWNETYRSIILHTSATGDVYYPSYGDMEEYKTTLKYVKSLAQHVDQRALNGDYEKMRAEFQEESFRDLNNMMPVKFRKQKRYEQTTYRTNASPTHVVTLKANKKRRYAFIKRKPYHQTFNPHDNKRILVNDRWIRVRDHVDPPQSGDFRECEDGTQVLNSAGEWVYMHEASTEDFSD